MSGNDETEMLEAVFIKFARVIETLTASNFVSAEDSGSTIRPDCHATRGPGKLDETLTD